MDGRLRNNKCCFQLQREDLPNITNLLPVASGLSFWAMRRAILQFQPPRPELFNGLERIVVEAASDSEV